MLELRPAGFATRTAALAIDIIVQVIALIALCGLAGFVYCLVQRKRGAMQ